MRSRGAIGTQVPRTPTRSHISPSILVYEDTAQVCSEQKHVPVALTWRHWQLRAGKCFCSVLIDSVERGSARAEDAQGTPTQSHISPSILEYTKNTRGVSSYNSILGDL